MEDSGPNEMEWKDSGFLWEKSVPVMDFVQEGSDTLKLNCRKTKILNGRVERLKAFTIRKEDHDWCSEQNKRQRK